MKKPRTVDTRREKQLTIDRLVARRMTLLRHDVGRDVAEYQRDTVVDVMTEYVEKLWDYKGAQ